jgi:Protein of unknown function (DUF465).
MEALSMTDNPHLLQLERKHARLEADIASELKRPMPDQALVAKLKSEKLKVRDEIAGH